MTPTGAVYSSLRANLLNTYPPGTKAIAGASGGLVKWLTTGAYTVSAATKSSITLIAAEDDFASMLLTEAELYTDHCFEQLDEIGCFAADTRLRSDGWNVVTIYYFGFFAVQVFLRLLGRPTYFLERPTVDSLRLLAGSATGPGAGAYTLERVQSLGLNRTEYRLVKSKQKIHESSWKTLFNLLSAQFKAAALPQTDIEAVFYSSLCPKGLVSHYHPYDWPPLIRARANYSAGFAYQLSSNKYVAKTRDIMRRWADLKEGKMYELLDHSAKACDASSRDDFDTHVRFLFDLSLTIFLLSRTLYGDLLTRRQLDRRWELRRQHYKARTSLGAGAYESLIPIVA